VDRNQAKDRWDRIRGRAKRAWGVLADDDIRKAEGSVNRLYGVIKERFGDTEEAIRAKLDKVDLK
jgi:uncharacterized protein YjbJ (UPF0337 family)